MTKIENEAGRELCDSRKLKRKAGKYIESCREGETLPNVAGFAVFCGIGKGRLEEILAEKPECLDLLHTYLEDGILNAGAPASIVASYLRTYFGYGEKGASEKESETVIYGFEHDIMKDGE